MTEPHHNGQVYPIIVAIGGACGVCVFQCLRHLTQSPDVSFTKSDRMMGVKEDKRFFKDGERFREHGVRRCGAALRGFGRGHGPSPQPGAKPELLVPGWPPAAPSAPAPWPRARPAVAAGCLACAGAGVVVSMVKPC